MKKIIVLLSLVACSSAFAQKNMTPPAAANASFTKAYPAATKIKWEKEDGNYEVSFELQGATMSANYQKDGTLLETEVEMKAADLPAAVLSYMKEHYKGVTLKGGAKITKPNGTIEYEAAIKGKDVLFDANGKFIKEAKD